MSDIVALLDGFCDAILKNGAEAGAVDPVRTVIRDRVDALEGRAERAEKAEAELRDSALGYQWALNEERARAERAERERDAVQLALDARRVMVESLRGSLVSARAWAQRWKRVASLHWMSRGQWNALRKENDELRSRIKKTEGERDEALRWEKIHISDAKRLQEERDEAVARINRLMGDG